MTTKPSILEALDIYYEWHLIDGRYYPAGQNIRPTKSFNYTVREFDEVDVRLSKLLLHFAPPVRSWMLKLNMRFWSRPDIWLPKIDVASGTIIGRHEVLDVESINFDDYPNSVTIKFGTYTTGETKTGIVHARMTLSFTVVFPCKIMNAHWPGWEKKYHIGMATGIDRKELARLLAGCDEHATLHLPNDYDCE